MANFKTFPKVAENIRMEEAFLRDIVKRVNALIDGKSNNTGEITLENGETSTIVKDINVGLSTVILLSPITSAAAGVNGIYIESGQKQFTVHHADPASTTASFRYVTVG